MSSFLMILLIIILYFYTYATTHAHDDLLHHDHQISSKDEVVIPKSSIHFEVKPDLSVKGLGEQESREDMHYDHDQIRHSASSEQKLFKQSSSSHGDLASDHEESEVMGSSQVQSSNYGVSGSWHVDDHPGFHLDYLPPRIHPPSHN
ncbi:hypothetical protein Sjap_004306 [Stephania japonica]|uniref:Uncharacterized protein n=1 Tax=Stephania japonica TaxID=461633 RepID=A0AAP0K218_9MAGN